MKTPVDAPEKACGEAGKMQVKFFPGCLVLSIVLSVLGTILLNVLVRALS